MIEEIASSSVEQSDGIEQVNGGLTRLEDIVQHNAAVSEQMAAAASELRSQAERIQQQVGRYTVPTASANAPSMENLPPELLQVGRALVVDRLGKAAPSELVYRVVDLTDRPADQERKEQHEK